MPPTAPPHIDVTAALRDGRPVRLRPLLGSDEAAYRRFVSSVSPRSQYYRFFTPRRSLSEREIDHFLHVDHVSRVALVAEAGDEIVAVARYDRDPGDLLAAEVAFVVRDDYQGQGLGPLLLLHLASAAHANGIRRLVATVLPDNRAMLSVFAKTGWVTDRHFEDGAIHITMDVPEPSGPLATKDEGPAAE